ncbi:MAG TPA: GAF domain-containing protein [Candidatus Limnocylindria bacterium]
MSGRRRRVAVLDDDPAFGEMMAAILADSGFRTLRPDLGKIDPVEATAATGADLLVLDLLGVGRAGGMDVLQQIRADARLAQLPVLVCSADVMQLRQHAARLSAMPRLAVLEKPFGVDVLLGTIDGLLEGGQRFPHEGGTPSHEATATLEAFLGRLGRTLRWAVADAWVPDRRPGLLRCAGSWVASIQLEPFGDVSRRTRLPVGSGLPGRTWMSRRAAWIEDLATDMNFPRLPVARRVGLVSAAAVPVSDHNEVVGVIAGYDTRLRRPDVASLDRLRRFVADAGPMLRDAAGTRAEDA